MLGLDKAGEAGARATASPTRGQIVYQRYAPALYRQALLMLADDPALAESVVCDVIVDECALSGGHGHSEDETRYRLTQSVFRRCQQSAACPGRRGGRPIQRPSAGVAARVDPDGILSDKERGALGLVLFGGLEYVQVSTVLGIGPGETAALLRAAMRRLGTPSPAATVAGDPI
ncbi:MAG: hypothetical protein WAK82_38135 [Streptosporangiaceae bacterium]